MLTNRQTHNGIISGCVRNAELTTTTATGTLFGIIRHGAIATNLQIEGVKYSPEIDETILRVQTLEKLGLHTDFGTNTIYERSSGIIKARMHYDNYDLPYIWVYIKTTPMAKLQATKEALSDDNTNHKRHGHLGKPKKKCEQCMLTKLRRRTPVRSTPRTEYLFGEVVSMDTDVMPTRSLEGYKYRTDVIDHSTGWIWGHGRKKKNDIENLFRDVLTEKKSNIKKFRVDGAREFLSSRMKQLAREYQFKLKKSTPYVHENFGRVERVHQTIDGMARAMLKTAHLPANLFWNLASQAAIYVRNRMPNKGNIESVSAYEARYGQQPDLGHLRFSAALLTPTLARKAVATNWKIGA